MSKLNNLEKLKQSGVVAVLRRVPKKQLFPLVETLINSGVNVLELTVDSEDAYGSIRELNDRFGDQALVGAGTVLTTEEATQALDVGAKFIFSPSFDKEVVKLTNDRDAISIPGVMTPTEIVEAHQAGADVVKIFPASAVGPGYLKDLQGPLGHIPMIPTGGVDVKNVGEFIQNGAVAVGVGGSLINKKAIENNDIQSIGEVAEAFQAEIRKARGE
ncbi:bifunctional 4-hydroxy-2-oxoglutarate aldolase/2-dehydro-3-deoxy-phosphogluconate aldolase [Filobacillus milosensis]|uniref:Bifunctional 4-hydroxy-2-oxoglutarate aldolase/2-dehydro-3-deoxy-phosphogluconate aldolase n=1 Tax=Filobacillus milosensis TaxID=94137 RepID=A0A4Y8IU30_9BACI|nr:bifunctional 4-hydroxy-2-oxoglutarate aldolase/2-dehydro-3-deoxy-phosphogluconate aldolase [Filobacillus milosensis]TFB24436.1 bifunctional 4-hydroxy-2-oxoglutarate aldolase/2-dehydro-3-deoxy-phosphogluconate aldolase [Filobacillus milosensis]